MTLIDTKRLREYMEDYYGTAAFSGFPLAMSDLVELDSLSDFELCKYAEKQGIDLTKFIADQG